MPSASVETIKFDGESNNGCGYTSWVAFRDDDDNVDNTLLPSWISFVSGDDEIVKQITIDLGAAPTIAQELKFSYKMRSNWNK